ncbi:MAG TPA: glycosyltransferase family 4 protein [Gemmatimonadaceae bacterium]|jgi:glycosyltransferase involved in cell wall biosynthesis
MTPQSTSRLRVVQVSFHSDPDRRSADALLDAWPTLPAVASAAQRANVDVTVVQAAHADETMRRDSVDYHFVTDAGRAPRRLLDAAAALAPDVLHVQGFHHANAIRRLAAACPRTPLLIQDHGSLPPTGWRSAAWRWALRETAGVAFTAREQVTPFIDARVLRRNVPVFEVIEGSTTFSPGDQAVARNATGLRGDPCVLWVGRLDANKDPLTMLSAIELAIDKLPGLRLWCCYGAAPLIDVVRNRIQASPALRERVTLLGARPRAEMELYFRSADLYVQTSRREGSGYALLEAMACGTPPIVSDIPAARRIIGGAGTLTPPGDVGAMANAIVSLAEPTARATASRAARARFESSLTFDAVGRELRNAYEQVAR